MLNAHHHSLQPAGLYPPPPPTPPVTLLRVKRAAVDRVPDTVHVRVKRRRLDNAFGALSLSGPSVPPATAADGNGARENDGDDDMDTVVFKRVRRASAPPDALGVTNARMVDLDGGVLRAGLPTDGIRGAQHVDDRPHDGDGVRGDGDEDDEDDEGDSIEEDNELANVVGDGQPAGDAERGAHRGAQDDYEVFAPLQLAQAELAGLGFTVTGATTDGGVIAVVDDDDLPALRTAVEVDDCDGDSDLDARTVDYPSTPGCSDSDGEVVGGGKGWSDDETSDEDEDAGRWRRRSGFGGEGESSDGEEYERYERFGRDGGTYDSEI